MIDKINELIRQYNLLLLSEQTRILTATNIECPKIISILIEILSDLEELKKLAEGKTKIESKLNDFINSQQPMPEGFSELVDKNFWELLEEK
jgi:hypothetical protein